ncbi:MAG: ECF transporter S component [Candidatus Bathyarchaeota archaeon]|nr:ECF transporter S component [Candidatus Bathyarchaeota archaeon]
MNKQAALRTPLKIALSAVLGALAAAVTISFVIPIPATSGYFNLGEAIVYISALIFGPFVGTFTGASIAIADILVPGAAQFAPGTLPIKGLEGAIVGILFKKLHKHIANTGLCASISVVVGGLEMIAGYFIYEQLFLSYPMEAALVEVPFNIVQMVIGLIIAVPVMFMVQRVFPQLKS